MPSEAAKIAIWISILEMKERGARIKAIAQYLNEMNVPSPDGEQLLVLVLRSLKHAVTRTGSRPELVRRLSELAMARSGCDHSPDQLEIDRLRASIGRISEQRSEIGKKLAVESDTELQQLFRSEFASKGSEISSLKTRLEKLEASGLTPTDDPQVQVQKALKLLDQLEKLAEVPEARVRINEVLKKLGIWVGLDFCSATWGKRAVRRISSGVLSIGGYHLPVPLHGRDNCDPNNPEGDCGCFAGPMAAADETVLTPGDGDGSKVGNPAKVDEKGDSSTKVSREFRGPVELFLASVAEWDAHVSHLLLAA